MRKFAFVLAAVSAMTLAGCTTQEGALVGGATGAAVGGLATDSWGGAIVGGAVGALAGAVLVDSQNDRCTYRYRGRIYHERCHHRHRRR